MRFLLPILRLHSSVLPRAFLRPHAEECRQRRQFPHYKTLNPVLLHLIEAEGPGAQPRDYCRAIGRFTRKIVALPVPQISENTVPHAPAGSGIGPAGRVKVWQISFQETAVRFGCTRSKVVRYQTQLRFLPRIKFANPIGTQGPY